MTEVTGFVHFSFEIHGLGQRLAVVNVDGTEGLSELHRFKLMLTSEDDTITFDDVVGKTALLTMTIGNDRRLVHGVVSRFEQADEGKSITAYEATLVAREWRLLRRHDSRIFQEVTVPQIIEQVLAAAGIAGSAYELRLTGRYRTREYCVQYRESDWHYLERLMEEEGIYYYFEHSSEEHLLVFADALAVHKPIPGDATVSFRPSRGAMSHGEHVHRFRFAQEVQSGKVTLRDWNFKKPELMLEGEAHVAPDPDLEDYDYPGEYDALGDASPLARIRLQQHQAIRRRGQGEAGCARFAPGSFYTLSEHPRDDFNGLYLLTHVEHHGSQPQMAEAGTGGVTSYSNRFTSIPGDVPFRAPSKTPRPTIKGIQTAIVVGPSGEEIYTDEHGRVKVQFHWDRQGKRDARSSCWIRVSQIWAGPAWGAIYIPRIGHEVVIDFLEGDPDRPLIVGRVYHGANVPPYPLPAEKTRSTIKSNSSQGGDGFNELRFEDKKAQEEIFLHAQKDWTIHVLHDKEQNVDHDEKLHVDGMRQVTVGVDQTTTIGQDFKRTVGRDRTSTVGNDEMNQIGGDRSKIVAHHQTEQIGGNKGIKVTGNHDETIGGDMSLAVDGDKRETVTKSLTERVTVNKDVTVDGTHHLAVKKKMTVLIEDDAEETVRLNKTVTVGEKIVIECGESRVTMEKDGSITVEGKDLVVKGSGSIIVQSAKEIDLKSDGPLNVQASGSVKIKGSAVGMN